MADCVKLTYDNVTYELTYTRESVKQMENTGFNFLDFVNGSKPATMNPLFFAGAFRARHPKIKRRLVDEIYNHLEKKPELIEVLVDLYSATLDTLVDSAAETDDGKNVTWTSV